MTEENYRIEQGEAILRDCFGYGFNYDKNSKLVWNSGKFVDINFSKTQGITAYFEHIKLPSNDWEIKDSITQFGETDKFHELGGGINVRLTQTGYEKLAKALGIELSREIK